MKLNRGVVSKLFLILIISVVFLSGCKEDNKKLNDSLYESKTEYIGDNSKVINILSNIEGLKEYESVEIEAKEKPYTLIIDFNKDNMDEYNYFYESSILFSLVENLDSIKYIFNEDEFYTNREDIDEKLLKDFGKDTKELFINKDEFKRLINEHEAKK